MKKISTVRVSGGRIFKKRELTIGLDLGDRHVATTPKAIQKCSGGCRGGRLTGTERESLKKRVRMEGR
jgi:hypothetical protein